MEAYNPKPQIWVLEDDEGAQFVYEEMLGRSYKVKMISNVQDYLAAEGRDPAPDLLIADLRLKDEVFTDYLDHMVKPCIIVSSIDDIDILRVCFDQGVDDYMTKPFARSELFVKVEKAIRGGTKSKNSFGGLTAPFHIDAPNLSVLVGERKVKLTPREMQILMVFSRPEAVLSREKIIETVWKDQNISAKTLDVHLFNLRRKLNQLGVEIQHVPPNRYSLVVA